MVSFVPRNKSIFEKQFISITRPCGISIGDKYGARYKPEDYVIDNKYKSALVDLNDDKIADGIVLFDDPDLVEQAAAAWKFIEAPRQDSISCRVVLSPCLQFESPQKSVMDGKRS
jgi:hypothetical protein